MHKQAVVITRTKKRKSWDPEEMKKAVEAVRKGEMGYKKAVSRFSVPKSTLKRLVKDPQESLDVIVRKPLGRKPVLPRALEDKLVKYILFMESVYYGLTRMDVRRLAYQLATKNTSPCRGRKICIGRTWENKDIFLPLACIWLESIFEMTV
jgi:hypothetical protein